MGHPNHRASPPRGEVLVSIKQKRIPEPPDSYPPVEMVVCWGCDRPFTNLSLNPQGLCYKCQRVVRA